MWHNPLIIIHYFSGIATVMSVFHVLFSVPNHIYFSKYAFRLLPIIITQDSERLFMSAKLSVSVARFIVQYRITILLKRALLIKFPAVRFHILTSFLAESWWCFPLFAGQYGALKKCQIFSEIFSKKFLSIQNAPVRKKAQTGA